MAKRMEDRLERGVWVPYGAPEDGYVASVALEFSIVDGSEKYVVRYGKEGLPPFHWEAFGSLDGVLAAMRQIAPLRMWRDCRYDQ